MNAPSRRMPRTAVRWAVAALASLPVHAATNQQPVAPVARTPITSHQRHFIVTDMPKNDAVQIAVWAESVRDRLIEWSGSEPPLDRVYPLVIGAALRTNEPNGRVLRAQRFNDDGFLQQELTFVNPGAMDQEDALESLTALLLNRWIHARQSKDERRARPGVFPDWFAVGVAQNLYPELRVRNQRELAARERGVSLFSPLSVTNRFHLPPGRWPEKAHAGMVVAWLADSAGAASLVAHAADRLAAGALLDADFMRSVSREPDERSISMAWDLWVAKQDRRLAPGENATDHQELARILSLPAVEFGLVMPPGMPDSALTVSLLIDERDQEWVHRYSRAVAWRLRQEAIGKTPQLASMAGRFAEFFDALALSPETDKKGRRKMKPKPVATLEALWNRAAVDWQRYIEEYSQREAMLDRHAGGEGGTDPAAAVRTMMDRWEP